MVIGMLFFTVVVLSPLIVNVIKIRRPLKVSPDATRLKVGLFDWTLEHVTGVVVDYNQFTDVYGGGVQYENGIAVHRAPVITDQHETLTLSTASGQVTQVRVVNYNVSPPKGHVVSVWNARKGSKCFTIAVLNHTTGQQLVNEQRIYSIMQPRQIPFVIYIVFTTIPVAFFSVFGGAGLPFVLWVVLLILYVTGVKRVQKRYRSEGLAPIWSVSSREASSMMVS